MIEGLWGGGEACSKAYWWKTKPVSFSFIFLLSLFYIVIILCQWIAMVVSFNIFNVNFSKKQWNKINVCQFRPCIWPTLLLWCVRCSWGVYTGWACAERQRLCCIETYCLCLFIASNNKYKCKYLLGNFQPINGEERVYWKSILIITI